MQYYVKALWAGVIAALGQLAVVLVGDATFGDITNGQWVIIVLFSLVAFGGVLGWQAAPANISTSVRTISAS
jgi:hypothetical protein